MDNSATSCPKPKRVTRAVKRALTLANPGRSTYDGALKASDMLYSSRRTVAQLVGTAPECVVFTYNATYALNMALFGVIREGMTVAYEPFAHNSVLRPLYALEKKGCTLELLEAHPFRDSVMVDSLERLVKRKRVDVLAVTHTSNVTGKRLPLDRLSAICKREGIILIVDGSQGVGSCDINMARQGIDILASSGHKGLFGIMGTGFLAVNESFKGDITPLISGGSGIFSTQREMPPQLPERLEAGTVGLPGIISVGEGARFVLERGAAEIGAKERRLRTFLTQGLCNITGVRVYNSEVNSDSIVLFNFAGTPSFVGGELLSLEGIALRSGYHCAPLAHKMLSDSEDYDGALRLSVGYFNTLKDCERVLKAVKKTVAIHCRL